MTFGITSTGFNPKTVQDVVSSLRTRQRGLLDPNLDISDASPQGQMNGTFAAEIAEVWEQLDFLANQLNPDDQEDEQQDVVCSLTGTTRLKATKGTCVISLVSSGAATWPIATIVAQEDNPSNSWVLDTAVVAGAAGTYPGNFTAQSAGHIEAPAGSLTVRVSSVPSWTQAFNPLDAIAGRNIETQPELALRREEELRGLGGASEPAITTDVEELNPTAIKSVRTFVNEGDVPDINGLPAHSFEVVVWDPVPDGPVDNDLLAQTIWNTKAFGIASHGSSSGTALTKALEHKTVFFTRPTVLHLFVSALVSVNVDTFPVDGDEQVKLALKAEIETLKPGDTVRNLRLAASCLTVEGVDDAGVFFKFGSAPSFADIANLTTTIRQIASLDTADITVTHV